MKTIKQNIFLTILIFIMLFFWWELLAGSLELIDIDVCNDKIYEYRGSDDDNISSVEAKDFKHFISNGNTVEMYNMYSRLNPLTKYIDFEQDLNICNIISYLQYVVVIGSAFFVVYAFGQSQKFKCMVAFIISFLQLILSAFWLINTSFIVKWISRYIYRYYFKHYEIYVDISDQIIVLFVIGIIGCFCSLLMLMSSKRKDEYVPEYEDLSDDVYEEKYFCSHCGKKLLYKATYCKECEEKLKAEHTDKKSGKRLIIHMGDAKEDKAEKKGKDVNMIWSDNGVSEDKVICTICNTVNDKGADKCVICGTKLR